MCNKYKTVISTGSNVTCVIVVSTADMYDCRYTRLPGAPARSRMANDIQAGQTVSVRLFSNKWLT